jgi:hypothetical protein
MVELFLFVILVVLAVVAVVLAPKSPLNWAILIVAALLALIVIGDVKIG